MNFFVFYYMIYLILNNEENDQLKEEMALSENATNVAKLMELNTKLEENEAALLELYDKWEELSE